MGDLYRPTERFKGYIKRLVIQGALVPVEGERIVGADGLTYWAYGVERAYGPDADTEDTMRNSTELIDAMKAYSDVPSSYAARRRFKEALTAQIRHERELLRREQL